MLKPTELTRPVRPQPSNPEKRVRKLIEVLKDKLGDRKESLLDYKAEALLVEGKEKYRNHDIRTLYVGACSNRDFILNRVYDRYDVVKKETIRIWRAGRRAIDLGHLADLIVMDIPWPYQYFLPRNRFIESPAWVCQRTDLSNEWPEVERNFSKEARTEDFRKIRKYGLSYETTNDASSIEAFYDQMYRPYLADRFGDLASIEPRRKIVHFARKGKLLQIKRDDHVVAAAVLYEWNKCMHFLWTGTREEPRSPLGRGGFSALYYYSILHAFETGCDLIDFEGTRPLLNDGVFLFKRKWGSYVCDGWCLDTFLFQPRRFIPAVVCFFIKNPMVIRKGNDLVGKVLFENEGKACTSKDLDVLVKRYGGGGLKHLEIAATGGYLPDAWEYAHSSPQAMHLVDLSRPNASVAESFVAH